MIDLTPYSILTVTVVTSIYIIIFILITQRKELVSKIPMWLPMTLAIIMCIRLLFPFEILTFSQTLLSFNVFPEIDNVFYSNIPVISNAVPSVNFTIVNIFNFVWIIGAVVFVINYVYEYIKMYKAIKYIGGTEDIFILNTVNRIKANNNFKFDVKIIVNKAIPAPSEFGFFRQVIFLNDYKYTEDELNYILFHELIHFYNKSNWIKLFMDMTTSILWWNPVVHILKRHIEDLLEMYVDAYVTKNECSQFRIGYLECIFKVYSIARGQTSSLISFVHSMAVASKEDILLKRCNIVRYGHKNNIPICILTIIILITYIFISSRYVVQPAYEPATGDFTYPEFSSENSYIVKEGDIYVLYYNGEPFYGSKDINKLRNVPIIN